MPEASETSRPQDGNEKASIPRVDTDATGNSHRLADKLAGQTADPDSALRKLGGALDTVIRNPKKKDSAPDPESKDAPKPWQSELRLHKHGDFKLSAQEEFAIMGSWTEEALETVAEAFPEDQQDRQRKILEAALDEMSNLDINVDSIIDAIADRKIALEEELKRSMGSSRATLDVRFRLAGLDNLRSTYTGIDDNAYLSTPDTLKSAEERVAERVANVNHLITEHNQWITRHKKPPEDSRPEQPTVEVTEPALQQLLNQMPTAESTTKKNQDVVETIDNTAEAKRKLLNEVVGLAKNKTRIHTDLPNDVQVKSTEGDYRPYDGFANFGDGLPQNDNGFNKERLAYANSAEAFLFEADTEARYETVEKSATTGRVFKKTETVTREVYKGETPVMIINPTTGQQEPGVRVAYQFNGSGTGYDGPQYITESGRRGNMLFAETTLPKSVADKLKTMILQDPKVARDFAGMLVMNNGGIPPEVWERVVRPPYDQLPNDWELKVAELQRIAGQHTAISEQAINF